MISIAVWVDSMVSIGVWPVVVSIGNSWGLDLNSLDDRLNIGIVKSIGVGVMKTIGDKWSSLNLSGLYFNSLDNRQMRNSMVSSIHKRSSVEKKLRISLSLSSDSSNEGNHQQELHVVIAM